MATQHWPTVSIHSETLPVFDGLDKVGLSGKDISDVAGVSPPTISKWRHAKAKMPDDSVALLTLLLGNRIEELHDNFANRGSVPGNWHFEARAGLCGALDDLRAQELLNKALSTDAVREGAKRFRHWWMAKGRVASSGAGSVATSFTDMVPGI